MNVKCMACGKSFSVSGATEGQNTHCVHCGKVLKMIRERPPRVATIEVRTNEPPRPPARKPAIMAQAANRKPWGLFVLQFVLCVAGLVVGAFALAVTFAGFAVIANSGRLVDMTGGDLLGAVLFLAFAGFLWWLAAMAIREAAEPDRRSKRLRQLKRRAV